MKKVFTLVFVCFLLLRVGAQSVDTSHFDSLNPQVGDYITIYLVWGCNSQIRPDVAQTMELEVISTLKKYPYLKFRLEVHSDCRADSLYNRQFTQRRADSLLAYILSKKDIDSSQITALGVGEDDLLLKKCQCDISDYLHICTEREHQQNRRTVLRVVGRKE
jgi:outer membrane protein OmpA-like peptidoglycan-associated protein